MKKQNSKELLKMGGVNWQRVRNISGIKRCSTYARPLYGALTLIGKYTKNRDEGVQLHFLRFFPMEPIFLYIALTSFNKLAYSHHIFPTLS